MEGASKGFFVFNTSEGVFFLLSIFMITCFLRAKRLCAPVVHPDAVRSSSLFNKSTSWPVFLWPVWYDLWFGMTLLTTAYTAAVHLCRKFFEKSIPI
jgi:hypothetical protein